MTESSSQPLPEPIADPSRHQAASPSDPERRDLLKKSAAVCLGAACVSMPLGAGAYFALDPLLRTRGTPSDGEFVRVTSLDAVQPGAAPRTYPIVADLEDSWNRNEAVEIGTVLLFRESGDAEGKDANVLAWSTICPHLGCKIDWAPKRDAFFCPCHASEFAADGSLMNNISPRGMDALETEVRDGEVWVKYVKYRTGTAEQVPV